MDDHVSVCFLRRVVDAIVAIDSVVNRSGHFHRGLCIDVIAIEDIVIRVNIYYSAHSRPPWSHS